MNFLKSIALVSALFASLVSASATPVPLNITVSGGSVATASPNSDIANYGDATVRTWLAADITAYNGLTSSSLPGLVGSTYLSKVASGFGSGAEGITLGGADYIFLHWGGQGGGWQQAFYIGGLSGNYTFNPPPGGNPAVGGLSFYSLYSGSSVPDGGTTMAMLGGALTLLGVLRRKLNA